MDFTAGLVASACVCFGSSVIKSVTRLGSRPFSFSTSRTMRTLIAAGSTALGCGFTITGLPVTSAANRPGYVFQVGKVPQPITSATPRPTTSNRFSITIGGFLPCGFSQRASAGTSLIAR